MRILLLFLSLSLLIANDCATHTNDYGRALRLRLRATTGARLASAAFVASQERKQHPMNNRRARLGPAYITPQHGLSEVVSLARSRPRRSSCSLGPRCPSLLACVLAFTFTTSHHIGITNIVWCIAYTWEVGRGRVLSNNRPILLHQGGQCRWAGGR